MIARRNAGSLQGFVKNLRTARSLKHLDCGHIQGISECEAQTHRAIEPVIVIIWMIKPGLGCEVGRDVGYDRTGKSAIFERPQIREWLHRGAGGSGAPGAVDLTNSWLEIIARSAERQHVARGIVDDNDGCG